MSVAYEELLQKSGYIEEVIDHIGFTENIYKDEDGNLIDITKQIKDMYEKDKSWANLAYKVSTSVNLRLSWLIELLQFHNNHWPIDYMELLENIKALQPFPFEYSFIDLSDKHDALTFYIEEHSLHIIFVNKNKLNYPHEHPTYKKLTFAIARELAHIALGHL